MELTRSDLDELIRLRRDFHCYPELAFEEHRTARVVAQRLDQIGFEVREGVGETGVVGVLRGDGPCLALRADMDALPVQEVPGRPHGSTVDGVMHACGHDGHVATLLVALGVLAREVDRHEGTILAVFQPAEEGGGGAKRMLADGVFDDPRPDAVAGLHYWSLQPTGTIGVTAGPMMGSVDRFEITVRGRGGHAAIPHEATDAIVAAAQVIGALQTVVSRSVDPLKPAVVTVGEVHAGTAFNVIAGEARLSGTVRTLDDAVWASIPSQIERVVRGVCAAHGCTAEIDYQRLDRPLVNDVAMTELVRGVAVDLVGAEGVMEQRTLGGEDMGEFLGRVPGCFFFVGAGNESRGITASHHHPAFDLDEDALAIGARMLVGVTRRYLALGQRATAGDRGVRPRSRPRRRPRPAARPGGGTR